MLPATWLRPRRASGAVLLFLGATLALPAPASPAAPPQAPDRFAIPATDDGLPGAGPIRRYEWFQDLWRERRSEWAQHVDQDRHAVVFLGDSITQGWGGGLGAAFPGAEGRQPRHQRRHHARRPAEAPGGRARSRPGGRRAADRHERPRGGRHTRGHRGQPAPHRRRPRAARPAHADHPVPGVPQLGDDETAGGPDQGHQCALSGGREERPAGHVSRDLAAVRRTERRRDPRRVPRPAASQRGRIRQVGGGPAPRAGDARVLPRPTPIRSGPRRGS